MVKRRVTDHGDYFKASKCRKEKELQDSPSESDECDASCAESSSDDDSDDDTLSETTGASESRTSSGTGKGSTPRDSEQKEDQYHRETARSPISDHDFVYHDCEEDYHDCEGDVEDAVDGVCGGTDSSSEGESSSDGDVSSSSDSGGSSNDFEDEDDRGFKGADEPLYPGAPLTTTGSIIAIFTVALRHKVTGVLPSAILSLTSLHCIRPHNCVRTLYMFKKFFAKLKTPLTRHYYCGICYSKLSRFDEECHGCELDYFLAISITEQLAKLYKRKGFGESLDRNFRGNRRYTEDVKDGSVYTSLPKDF
ncbi:hypothetical protein QAD02_012928 [Eretmocerus hayati]|uniref:Uncharacterized protein n=1 Tax=Eretmocerus hayati TaxID=131215 RepID=A0ACC2P2W2_9HYME|nr:hypothetical protein QAD02_012928 [Eretmocerus hayati]